MKIQNKKASYITPIIITIISSLVLFLTIFMPYSSATKEHAENLKENSEVVIYEELDIRAKDMLHLSMVEYANVYTELSEEFWGDSANGIFYLVLVILIGAFSLLSTLFSALKKPILTIVFALLSFGVFSLQNWDYTDRGVIPSSTYDWGIGHTVFYIAFAVLVLGAVWVLINKIRIKSIEKNTVTE